jgi:glycosyltransferase involved in cell wall biosynthesis
MTTVADPGRAPAPIRVLMVTTEWPRDTWGGTATFIPRQAEYLRAAGVAVEVFHFRGAQSPLNYGRAWVEVQRRVRSGRFDLVHAQFGQSGLTALPRRLPLVVTLRGDDLQGTLADADGRMTLSGRVLARATRAVARRADAVIVVSAHMRRLLDPGVAAHVIPSGLDLAKFQPMPAAEARARLGLPLDRRLVLFVGRPTLARKRHTLARQAVDLVDPALGADLVVGWGVPHADIPVYMSACDALIFTSMQEGSPNVVKEALACNLPVVSVDVGDVVERLHGVDNCTVTADDRPATIAAALEAVLRRGGRCNGRAAVAALAEETLTQQVIAIYRTVLGQRPAPAPSRGVPTACVES